MTSFGQRLVAWQRTDGRHHLPWQSARDAYRRWLSEIMLQQTQVRTVIPFYTRFVAEFPSVEALAKAPLERVLELWSGLGYYGRARNLHECARLIVERHHGEFPRTVAELAALPGMGRSTAAAVCVFAHGVKAPILDGNVRRVLSRHRGVAGNPTAAAVQKRLWAESESLLPDADIEAYTQALMDLGATVCTRTRPRCGSCPVRGDCVAFRENRIGELPGRRPRKALAQRDATMLMVRYGEEILLERRPPTGIWGGLWSLPELPEGHEARAYCRVRFGANVEPQPSLGAVRHTFTHFTLVMTPLPCAVVRLDPAVHESGLIWLGLCDVAGAALPAPIKRLLGELAG